MVEIARGPYSRADILEEADLEALQEAIRQRLLEASSYHIVQTRLERGVFPRVALMNSGTRLEDLEALLDEIRMDPG